MFLNPQSPIPTLLGYKCYSVLAAIPSTPLPSIAYELGRHTPLTIEVQIALLPFQLLSHHWQLYLHLFAVHCYYKHAGSAWPKWEDITHDPRIIGASLHESTQCK